MDAGLFALGFWLAHLLRSCFPNPLLPEVDPILGFEYYLWMYLLIIPFAPLLLDMQGYYSRPLFHSMRATAWQLAKGCSVAVILTILLLFLMREQLSRSVMILYGGITFILLMVKEWLVQRWASTAWGGAQMQTRLVLLHSGDVDSLNWPGDGLLENEGAEIVSQLDLTHIDLPTLAKVLHEHNPNGVVIHARHAHFGQVEEAIQFCEMEGVEVWLVADFVRTRIARTTVDDLFGKPTLVFRSAPDTAWQALAKQALDVLVAGSLLIALSPFMAFVALRIRMSSPGPVIFRQKRSGLNGRPFTMLKFRSMVVDAESRREELERHNEMEGPVFKMTQDPRITEFGRWMRRYSVDELPQLWNVLFGEMSLVGPRPLPVEEIARIDDLAHRRRLSVKPGLTCLWQISGRNEVRDFEDWVRLDLEYIDNWSLFLDLKILLKTVPVVLMGSGAR